MDQRELISLAKNYVKSGSREDFSHLLSASWQYVCQISQRFFGSNYDSVEDIASETATRLIKHFSPGEHKKIIPDEFHSFLMTTARNIYTDSLRKRKAIACIDDIPENKVCNDSVLDVVLEREGDHRFSKLLKRVDEALGRMPNQEIAATTRSYLLREGSAESLAEELGINAGTLKWRAHEAIKRLRTNPDIVNFR